MHATMMQGKTVLVTGGAGFVGRRLVEMAIQRGAVKAISLDIRVPELEATTKSGKKVYLELVYALQDKGTCI